MAWSPLIEHGALGDFEPLHSVVVDDCDRLVRRGGGFMHSIGGQAELALLDEPVEEHLQAPVAGLCCRRQAGGDPGQR